jgi:hypothetical protein
MADGVGVDKVRGCRRDRERKRKKIKEEKKKENYEKKIERWKEKNEGDLENTENARRRKPFTGDEIAMKINKKRRRGKKGVLSNIFHNWIKHNWKRTLRHRNRDASYKYFRSLGPLKILIK